VFQKHVFLAVRAGQQGRAIRKGTGNQTEARKGTGVWVTERQKLGAKLDPWMRDFVDRVIVPALVREYIAENAEPNSLAEPARAVRQFPSKSRLLAEGIQ